MGVNQFTEFPLSLENLENENGHGKVMEREKLAKSHGILSVMEFYQFCPKMYQICMFFTATKKLSIDVKRNRIFRRLRKMLQMQNSKERRWKIDK